ncbi:MAG: hypothetical protein J6C07_07565 [Lachnospiraceae bacterium]|nr:hypothetical protein [Lachnospiraceae bacterium]
MSFKKFVTTALVMVMLVCSMAACGKSLSGSYESEVELLGQSWNVTYTFKGKNVEAVSKVTILGNVQNTTSTGTYELVENADGTMEITIDFENETDLFKDGTFTFEEAEEYIKIGKSQYNKIAK